MYALAIVRYRRPIDEVVRIQDDHRAYLRALMAEGTLLASGPLEPRYGGALLLRVPDEGYEEALDRVRDGDPYVRTGVAQYEILPWKPGMGVKGLDTL
ncbi:MAG TPA: YciI family protein [Gemmatimonadaceae bacterium]|nr:YciI family protein [Gemmatimonadaceae bacterium]